MSPKDIAEESGLTRVLSLADEFRKSSDTNVLACLADLVADPRFGANAAAAITGLKRKLQDSEIEKIVMPALIKGLEAADPSVRRQCAISISTEFCRFAGPAIPVLAALVENPDEASNAAPFAADALGKMGSAAVEAIPSLTKVLDRPETESGGFEDASVRVRAADAIGQIGITADEVRRQLESSLSDSNLYVRAKSAQALIQHGFKTDETLNVLAELMRSQDVGIRRFAFHVLRELQTIPESLVQHVKAGLRDSDAEVRSAARALLNQRTH